MGQNRTDSFNTPELHPARITVNKHTIEAGISFLFLLGDVYILVQSAVAGVVSIPSSRPSLLIYFSSFYYYSCRLCAC